MAFSGYLQNLLQFGSWIIPQKPEWPDRACHKGVFLGDGKFMSGKGSRKELFLVRNYMIGQQLASLDGPFQIMERWKGIILNELDENFFNETIETIKEVSAKELQEIAQKYFNPDDFYQLVAV